ncbi:MAG: hypothetical protein BLM47_10385 [Candidatus Reconcilbacillus cellulovorans]|uniref:AB hydrolase-1 domain-containing protein n=1 Tax=Candidatus Reconcilbacillus cellulovorans TaxID=1906605 RepID=A0A2A6DZA2_9BACL|nr:MAG: hypothetical protein BLM47_10385 [Candidatus Reconcilbacillus cellulovorans]
MTARFLDRGGRRIAYETTGEGRPVVLLLHGFCGSSRYWSRIAPKLGRRWTVVAPDLPGHGASDPLAGSDDGDAIETFADDIAALIRELAPQGAVVLGHSLGGYVTLALVEHHPELVRAFGLVHSTALADTEQTKAARESDIALIRATGIATFVAGKVPVWFAEDTATERPQLIAEAKLIGFGTNRETAIRILDAMRRRPDRTRLLREADRPVLLVAGERDRITPPERVFAADHPLVTTATVPKAGHMGMMENPERLTEIIETFLSRPDLTLTL